ncbi:polysaccharide deacetylase family protein [Maritimibacter dapengensis]|uniref:Chitooligosaccharide deacetylase n=1 Tax=Maritimibacter dapengensis TaxID=2836868 RepID=A0ABS6T3N2_9RHOB|nr:polysaccharide deacetylase family protein [Maritimibacter dapengensis]MBV7379805.1 polysaccharide deacetylase family protein [Maritimibacter dapengensis]
MLDLILIVALAVVFASSLWYFVPWVVRRVQTRSLRQLCAQKRAIVLTFDDGPSESFSSNLADFLEARNARATFFLIGENATNHSDFALKLHDSGHEIGSHTRHHTNAWQTPPVRSIRDVMAGREDLKGIGIQTHLFRPPFGKITLGSLIYASRVRDRLAFWTIDSRDSWAPRPVKDVLKDVQSQGGGVILMHDFERPLRGPNPEGHKDYVISLTGALLDFADKHDFAIMRFGDLFDNAAGASAR